MSPPQLWVLAGGNGAGKSTFYRCFLEPRGLRFINADRIALTLDRDDTVSASYEAARIAERIRRDLLLRRQSFCFETVFSHPSKIDLLGTARARGYEITLVLIHLDDVALNKARVAQRVSEGGHPVPEDKIESRVPRTLRYVKAAIDLCDRVELLDNSSHAEPFRRVASVRARRTIVHVDPLPPWAEGVLGEVSGPPAPGAR